MMDVSGGLAAAVCTVALRYWPNQLPVNLHRLSRTPAQSNPASYGGEVATLNLFSRSRSSRHSACRPGPRSMSGIMACVLA